MICWRQRSLGVLTVALVLTVAFARTASATPLQYSVNGHWYDFVESADMGWLAAKRSAESTLWMGMAGHLATISSEGENAFISAITHGNAYLGATDGLSEGQWVWVTGEPFSYTQWGPGEPNDAPNAPTGEDFLMMWHSVGWPSPYAATEPYEWNDIFNNDPQQVVANNSNGYMHGYFIEFEGSVPEPGTLTLLGLGLAGLAAARRRKQ